MSATSEQGGNPLIQKAYEELKRLSADPEVRKLYEARLKQKEKAKGKGYGTFNEQMKELLDEGVSVGILVKLTGLPAEEIEKLR